MTEHNDRELLEKAAKAAGIDARPIAGRDPRILYTGAGSYMPIAWNPLTDDGDALRLGVALEKKHGFMSRCRWLVKLDLDDFDVDPGAAIRRAFVRAAASIGDSHD